MRGEIRREDEGRREERIGEEWIGWEQMRVKESGGDERGERKGKGCDTC